ncbi:hypothetical protein [Chryseobacterium indologenes]|uniref:hypothetical protein n=1 Tax=Chryseobacterium indologenes TaxID=253 RepID=UPI001628E48C|nr:hypothetical protein [Chryseobacterium indologenes]
MKILEIELNKRLLIVEYDDNDPRSNIVDFKSIAMGMDNEEKVDFICKGSDLTEDIAKGLVESELQTAHMFGQVVFKLYDYNGIDIKTFGWTNNALKSFISAIESKGYHWGENPVKLQNVVLEDGNELNVKVQSKEWIEAESRTFYPEKCIICEKL